MKSYLVILGIIIYTGSFLGQDIVNLSNKTSIKVKVINVGVKTISYKKFDNLDGPTYEVRNREVNNILYENGTQEIIKTSTQDFNDSKNIISFNYGDLFASRVGVSYERLFAKSKLGIKIPISASFLSNTNKLNRDYAIMQTGLDVIYYPFGQKTVTFFTGLSSRVGKVTSINYHYEPYLQTVFYPTTESSFISAYVNNGLVVHFNDSFSVSGQVGVGLRNIYQNYQSTEPHVNGELNASFRF